MTEITLAKTRWKYDSYTDLYSLFELAGFPSIYADELDVSRPGVIITAPMNGDWREILDGQAGKVRNCHLILWNIERPSGSAGSVGQYAESNRRLLYGQRDDGSPAPCRYADEVWVSDRALANETGMRYVALGSHPDLGEPGRVKQYDFCHMSYENPRRQTVLKHLKDKKLGPNCWPPLRDDVLAHSKFALNIHQDNHPFLEPLRFALFAAYGLPIVSEFVYDAWPYGDDIVTFSGYEQLPNTLVRCLNEDYDRFRKMGQAIRERMCVEFEFGKVVREAVRQSVGDWR
jgi:hypothetical protein